MANKIIRKWVCPNCTQHYEEDPKGVPFGRFECIACKTNICEECADDSENCPLPTSDYNSVSQRIARKVCVCESCREIINKTMGKAKMLNITPALVERQMKDYEQAGCKFKYKEDKIIENVVSACECCEETRKKSTLVKCRICKKDTCEHCRHKILGITMCKKCAVCFQKAHQLNEVLKRIGVKKKNLITEMTKDVLAERMNETEET